MKPYLLCLLVFGMFGCAAGTPPPAVQPQAPSGGEVPSLQLREFELGPGDVLAVQVWRHPDLNRETEIQADGSFAYPLVGPIPAAGMGLTRLHALLTERLSEYLVDPQVTIQVKIPKSRKVYVLGEVRQPGAYLLDRPLTPAEALGLAGGFTYNAKEGKVLLMHRTATGVTPPRLLDLRLRRGKGSASAPLQPGDILYVPMSNVALVDRFFAHVATAVGSLIGVEQGVIGYPATRDILKGEESQDGVSPVVVISPQ